MSVPGLRRRTTRTGLVFATATAVAASVVSIGSAHAVVGTPDANRPYVGRLNIGDEANSRACSAVLVDRRWVMTAASCFAKTPGSPVVAGKPELKTTVTIGKNTLAVATLVPRDDRDVVLARLSKPVTDITPVKIAARQPAVAAPVTAAGFGRTKTDWVPGKVHTAAYGVTSVDATALAIAGKGADSICQGDAGGPLVNGQGELVGISTRSWQGGCLGTPDTETRTDAIAARADDLRGWTTEHVTPVPGDMTGDGLPDMVAIDTDGKLRLYPGNGTGGLGKMVEIGTGGWGGAQITHRGDWTGDGLEDLVAVVAGELRVYPNRGDGTLGAPIKMGTLPTSVRIVSAGDMTGDGQPDLLVSYDDKLWRYPGVVGPVPKYKTPVQIGSSGWNVMTLTSPGDATKNGRPDLLARDTRDGKLWLYPGRENGSFGQRTEFGRGYTTSYRPLIAGAADANRDGVADLWATANDGALKFYRGGTGAEGPVDGPSTQIGTNWQTIKFIS
ncbi:FG-GAP-like repeat-containing protein [Streptomyces sp. NPDC051546]|uniref:FG-GAP-like repeat-containing protein n=1 Tax=Streptomyces sp. NPDC051546 TaxID=3365655 RepID=UPI00379DF39B